MCMVMCNVRSATPTSIPAAVVRSARPTRRSRSAPTQTDCASRQCHAWQDQNHAGHRQPSRNFRKQPPGLKGGQDWKQEIVAELSAAVLCRLVGTATRDTSGNSYRYIQSYAEKAHKDTLKGISAVIGDVEKVLGLILTTSQSGQSAA